MSPLLRTLVDIGPRRLQRRLRYELRQRLDRRLPPPLALLLAGAGAGITAGGGGQDDPPGWRAVLLPLAVPGLSPPPPEVPLRSPGLPFTFLNQTRRLPWPLPWNDPGWERLWQFHLHYFDWAREWLDQALVCADWPPEARALEPLIDHWIAANSPGRGDGWHSYTLSLRSRNWIWLFRCCPALATPQRLHALWQQLRWLEAHPEHCHGGNHWLENLTALAIGGLQFEGARARRLQQRALRLLQRELAVQLLADGGHEERSASYHLLMLDRLVELACTLASVSGDRPAWLLQAIAAMSLWARAVRLEGGQAPRFNDSAADAAPPLDGVLAFAEAFLQGRPSLSTGESPGRDLRQRLLESAAASTVPAPLAPPVAALPAAIRPAPGITDLPATGWTILRPGHHWELLFKCGTPCPDHLPAHVHSDQLSVELIHRGRWWLAEAGTSLYGTGPERAHERSGAAHNVLQLGRRTAAGAIHWIEPVEVWHGFRAGRKARPRLRACGSLPGGGSFVEGSHDGFDRVGARHHRRVEIAAPAPDQLELRVIDTVITRGPVSFRLWWHRAPEAVDDHDGQLHCQAPTALELEEQWHDTWLSVGFGRRLPRRSFCLQGLLPPGRHGLLTTFQLSATSRAPTPVCPASG